MASQTTSRPDSGFVTDEEASRYLHVHPQTMAKWRREGYGPPRYVVGGRRFYRLTEVQAWLESTWEIPGEQDAER